MNFLITGGAGFIGSRLVNALFNEGHDIIVIDSLSPQVHGEDPSQSPLYQSVLGKCVFHKAAVEAITDWTEYLLGVDVLIHLAAETGTGQSMYDIYNYEVVNGAATAKLAQALLSESNTISKVVVSSSRAIYGEGSYHCEDHGSVIPSARFPKDMDGGNFEPRCPKCGEFVSLIATSESIGISPNSIYGLTKYNQEKLLQITCESVNIAFTALRYQNVYGPGQSLKNPYTGILSIFSNLILTNEKINIFEDGLESRDFVFVDDVVEITKLVSLASESISSTLNVGTGVAYTVLDVVETLEKCYGKSADYSVSGNYRLGDIRHNYADLAVFKTYFPNYTFKTFYDGVREFCDWVLTQQLDNSKYEKSLEEMKKKGLMK